MPRTAFVRHRVLPCFLVALSALVLFGYGAAAPSAPSWYDPSWGYRMKITASSVLSQGGPYRDYTLVVRLGNAQSSVFNHGNGDGSDIVITKQDGITSLARQVVTFSPGKHYGEIWVRDDTLSTSSKEYYLYYGNPLASLPPSDGSVWPSSYLGVYHFADDPGLGLLTDSGPGHQDAHTGLLSGFTSQDSIAGAVGQAWLFNGTTHWVDGDGLASSDSSFTISAWFACRNQFRPGDADFALSVEAGFWHLSAKRNSDQRAPDATCNNGFFTWPPSPLPDTLLHYYVWSMDGVNDTIRFFYDGVEQTPLVAYSPTGKRIYTGYNIAGNVGIASPLFGNNNHFDLMEGIVDEYWIREGALSAGWAASTYRNQKSPLFLTYGPEEPYGVVPVTLLGFEASWSDKAARIDWEVSGSDAASYRLRRDDAGGSVDVTEVASDGRKTYEVLDRSAPSSGAVYRLDALERDGSIHTLGSTRLDPSTGLQLALGLHPNPFRATTQFSVRLGEAGHTDLRVFDLAGHEVAHPWQGWLTSGTHEIPWNGTGANGQPLATGIYLLRLETPSGVRALKMTRMP